MNRYRKLSPGLLNLPSGYRTTAFVEIQARETTNGKVRTLTVARFQSTTPGQFSVYALQTDDGEVKEISSEEFYTRIAETAALRSDDPSLR